MSHSSIAMTQLHKYTDMQNVNMHRNPETLTTFFSSGTKRLLIFFTFYFSFSTQGERHNFYYANCSYIVLQSTPQRNWPAQSPISTNWPNKRAMHPVVPSLTALAQVQISTNCFFQKSPKFPAHHFWAWRHSHPISYLGFLLWHLWLLHPPCACVNTCTKSQTVQSLTKPNDKI